jgi:DNA repair exonuclease SbcCD ATPase subunit
MEADMNRITFRDLVLAVFVLIAVFQSLTMLSFSHQRMMAQEMFAAMPFTEGDYIRKSHSLLKEKQELIKKRDSLEKQVKELEDKKQSLETKHTATQNKVEQLTKSETDLKGKVESLQSNQKRLEQQIKRLGGKVPRGFFSQTAPLWVVIGGGILLAALASAVAVFVTMRKFQQELLKVQSQKPSA